MFSTTLSSTLFAALSATLVAAQGNPQETFPATRLADKRFPDPSALPYKVDTDDHLIRGGQRGYNRCNETTLGQDSLCQTSWFNSIEDFCLWGIPEYGKDVGSVEGEMVAWCTKPTHGTRLIPANALQGVQWMKTPDYVQAVGFIDQTALNILPDDFGGEMDPHGADLRGNPLGGLIYSEAFNGQVQQVIEWHNFIGASFFCLKICDPAGPNAARFCEHKFDRIGCAYNAPNAARNGTFESCEGENQDFPGTYTGADGRTSTYTQPGTDTSISTLPYTARIPASSNCVTHTSSVIYAGLPTVRRPNAPAGEPTPDNTGSSTSNTPAQPTNTSGNGNGNTNNNNNNNGSDNSTGDENDDNGASTLAISGISILGVLFSAFFFA